VSAPTSRIGPVEVESLEVAVVEASSPVVLPVVVVEAESALVVLPSPAENRSVPSPPPQAAMTVKEAKRQTQRMNPGYTHRRGPKGYASTRTTCGGSRRERRHRAKGHRDYVTRAPWQGSLSFGSCREIRADSIAGALTPSWCRTAVCMPMGASGALARPDAAHWASYRVPSYGRLSWCSYLVSRPLACC
jgi:hypothetical protein